MSSKTDRPDGAKRNGGKKYVPVGFASLAHISVRRWFAFYGLVVAVGVGLCFLVGEASRPLIYCFLALTVFTSFIPGNVTYVLSLLSRANAMPGFLEKYVGGVIDTGGWGYFNPLVVALVCAAASIIANMNDYHGLVLIFRANKVREFGRTRFYQTADKWFEQAPFALLLIVNFLPLPVSVVRWFAVTRAYPRWRLALAGFMGRLPRYWLTVVAYNTFRPRWWQTILACVIIALIPVAVMRIKGKKAQPETSAAEKGNLQ